MDGHDGRAGPRACGPQEAPPASEAQSGGCPALADVAADFDRIADLPVHRWDHNRCYYSLMLRHLPRDPQRVLDVGCGTGELVRLLASRARSVEGMDLSAGMLAAARAATAAEVYGNVTLACGDAFDGRLPSGAYDAILSAATLHHVDLRVSMQVLYAALKPGGTLIVLDLYEPRTPGDKVVSCAAALAEFVMRRVVYREGGYSEEETAVWDEHGGRESYPTLAEVSVAALAAFGNVRLRRLLFWRYLLVCRKAD